MTSTATVAERRALAEAEGRHARRSFTATCETRDVDGKSYRALRGYASVTAVEYDMRWYVEEIAPGAFDKTLREKPDVVLLVNHEGLPLARTKAGDLDLQADTTGLLCEAPRLDPEDPDVARLAKKMDAGHLDEMSFAFRIERQEWNEDYSKRYITEVSLHRGDVSVVNYGANPNTSVSLRGAELLARLDDLSPEEQRAVHERLGVLLQPTDETELDEAEPTQARSLADLRRHAALLDL